MIGIADRVKCGAHILETMDLSPKWFVPVNRRILTFRDKGPNHLLSQVFGSFEAGAQRVTLHSGNSLEELGLIPFSKEDEPTYKDETLFLLRQWVMMVSLFQSDRKTA
jgi:hypothetical protein